MIKFHCRSPIHMIHASIHWIDDTLQGDLKFLNEKLIVVHYCPTFFSQILGYAKRLMAYSKKSYICIYIARLTLISTGQMLKCATATPNAPHTSTTTALVCFYIYVLVCSGNDKNTFRSWLIWKSVPSQGTCVKYITNGQYLRHLSQQQ